MLLGFAIIGIIRTLIFNFVAEKEERFKETQKVKYIFKYICLLIIIIIFLDYGS